MINWLDRVQFSQQQQKKSKKAKKKKQLLKKLRKKNLNMNTQWTRFLSLYE